MRKSNKMKILFLIPSKLDGPSARYITEIAHELENYNYHAEIASLDSISSKKVNNTEIKNHFIQNDRTKLEDLISNLIKINFDIVFTVGSRYLIDLISIKLKLSGSVLIKQFEDDEQTIFENCNKNHNRKTYQSELLKGYNEDITTFDFFNYKPYNVVDPTLKGMTLALLDGYTKIWGELNFDEETLLRNLDYLSLPPVTSDNKINEIKSLQSNKDNDFKVYFIGGSIYSKHDAEVFLKSWSKFNKRHVKTKLYISRSRTSKVVLDYIENEYQYKYGIELIDLPDDDSYSKVLLSSDYVVSIGGGEFDKRRLPSRLVKSMMIGKVIIAPLVGFGRSIEKEKSGFVCKSNSEIQWLKTLEESYNGKNKEIKNNSITFAKKYFSIQKVTSDLDAYFKVIKSKNKTKIFKDIEIEHLLLADYMSLINARNPFNKINTCKRLKFSATVVDENIIIQTLDREDYRDQVNQFIKSIRKENEPILESNKIEFVDKYNPVKIGSKKTNPSIAFSFTNKILKEFFGKFKDINKYQRSFLVDKISIILRIFESLEGYIKENNIKNVIFHADMQSTEALLCELINKNIYSIETYTLQHALYYCPKDKSDVNIVNTKVSPSKSSLIWDQGIAEKILEENPEKNIILLPKFKPFNLKNFNINADKKELLLILDGPNNDKFNKKLIELSSEYAKKNKINELHIKPHPYHEKNKLEHMAKNIDIKFINAINCPYEKVVFLTSTLGYELHDFGFSTLQLKPNDLINSVQLISKNNTLQFTSEKKFHEDLENKSKTDIEKLKESINYTFNFDFKLLEK